MILTENNSGVHSVYIVCFLFALDSFEAKLIFILSKQTCLNGSGLKVNESKTVLCLVFYIISHLTLLKL